MALIASLCHRTSLAKGAVTHPGYLARPGCKACIAQKTTCHAIPVATLAEANLQDVIVGGAVVVSVGAALYGGLRKDPVTCDLCFGTGGTKCFGCNGDGKMLIPKDLAGPNASARRSSGPRRCKVCKGVGMVLCSKCKGSGFIQPSQLDSKEVQTGQGPEE